jgi:hypothetical protein
MVPNFGLPQWQMYLTLRQKPAHIECEPLLVEVKLATDSKSSQDNWMNFYIVLIVPWNP